MNKGEEERKKLKRVGLSGGPELMGFIRRTSPKHYAYKYTFPIESISQPTRPVGEHNPFILPKGRGREGGEEGGGREGGGDLLKMLLTKRL